MNISKKDKIHIITAQLVCYVIILLVIGGMFSYAQIRITNIQRDMGSQLVKIMTDLEKDVKQTYEEVHETFKQVREEIHELNKITDEDIQELNRLKEENRLLKQKHNQ